jgi:hypothetical protein
MTEEDQLRFDIRASLPGAPMKLMHGSAGTLAKARGFAIGALAADSLTLPLHIIRVEGESEELVATIDPKEPAVQDEMRRATSFVRSSKSPELN